MNKTTALVFFGILAVGISISLIVLNQKGEKVVIDDPAEEPVGGMDPKPGIAKAEPAASPSTGSGKPGGAGAEASPATKSAPRGESPVSFSAPEKAMETLSEKIAEKDFGAFLGLVGEGAVAESIRPEVRRIIESPHWKLDPEKPRSELSKSAASVRWSLNFVPDVSASPAVEGSESLYIDLAGSSSEPYVFDKVSLPLDLTRMSASVNKPGTDPTSANPTDPSKPIDPEPTPAVGGAAAADPLTVALAFSKAIVDRDFQTARALADPAVVTDERVAALMIAVEEGGFVLREERPMVVTLSREDITWVLTRIQSENAGSEFALELGNSDGWKVNGLTFSKVLSALADQAGGGDVAYSPIVEDPMGGDSLVLYFEFDADKVTPRGNRQLAIIADILSQGVERVIRINGHADALGTDQYNAQLSDSRAAAIRKALISMGVSPDQVVTEAFGATKPRQPNFKPDGSDNPAGRSKNRRAEVYLDF